MRRFLVCLALGMVVLCGPALRPASGQLSAPRLGAGFVVNAPNQYLGFEVQALSSRFGGLGLYVDAKFDIDSPGDEPTFIPDLTVQEVEDELGDEFFAEDASWRSVNVALMRPVTPELTLYAGAGYARRQVYRQYIDPSGERGLGGSYWVADPSREGATVNVLGGGFFRITRHFSLQFGLESAPRGATVGGAFNFGLGGN